MNANAPQGLSLLDLTPLTDTVPYGGQLLNVYCLSAEALVGLFTRFPEVQKWFSGGGKRDEMAKLVAEAPAAIAAIVAEACHTPGEAGEEVAGQLGVETQLDVLEVTARLTFTQGFIPFVQRIMRLADAARSAVPGKGTDTKSPPQSKPSSPVAGVPPKSGV